MTGVGWVDSPRVAVCLSKLSAAAGYLEPQTPVTEASGSAARSGDSYGTRPDWPGVASSLSRDDVTYPPKLMHRFSCCQILRSNCRSLYPSRRHADGPISTMHPFVSTMIAN